MESNWRWLVYELGLDPEVYRLCARRTDQANQYVCKAFLIPAVWRYQVLNISFGWPYIVEYQSLPMPANAPFRPPFPVEPD